MIGIITLEDVIEKLIQDWEALAALFRAYLKSVRRTSKTRATS